MLNHISIGSGYLLKLDRTRPTMRSVIIFFLAFLLTPVASFSETTIYRLTGQSATAIFNFTDPSGCLFNEFSLSASVSTQISAPSRETSATQVYLQLLQVNQCTNSYVSGYALSSDLALKMNPALTQATLQGTIPVCFYSWPDPAPACTNLAVDLNWSGLGNLSRQSSNDRYMLYPGSMVTNRNSGNFRDALVTGTVLDGTINLTPADATQFGYLGFSQQQTLTIFKQ